MKSMRRRNRDRLLVNGSRVDRGQTENTRSGQVISFVLLLAGIAVFISLDEQEKQVFEGQLRLESDSIRTTRAGGVSVPGALVASKVEAPFGLNQPIAVDPIAGNLASATSSKLNSNLAGIQDEDAAQSEKTVDDVANQAGRLPGSLVRVPLPITQSVDAEVKQQVERFISQVESNSGGRDRPVLVLEFDTSTGATGEGSELERCLALARFLTSSELSQVRTVAYVPGPRGMIADDEGTAWSQLRGHAVLVALACEAIVLHERASLGAAGIDETEIDELELAAYRTIVNRRRTIFEPVAMAMLDARRMLYQVRTTDGVEFVDEKRLRELETSGKVIDTTTISERDSLLELTSDEWLGLQLIRDRVNGRLELARRFNVEDDALLGDPSLGEAWRAVLFEMKSPLTNQDVGWFSKSMRSAVSDREVNLIVIELHSKGGVLAEGLRLAQDIADLDEEKVRTVAYVSGDTAGPATLVALACDHLIVREGVTFGGEAKPKIDPEEIQSLLPSLQDLAKKRVRDWSIFYSMLDPTVEIRRYRNRTTGQERLLTGVERDSYEESELWVDQGSVKTNEGLQAEQAERLSIARYVVADLEELKTIYQLEDELVLLEPTLAHRWIEDLGRKLSSPWIAGWLLFGAMFFLSTELSQPGLGIPGFVSAILFSLFLWSQYCEGNVQWFEVLLLLMGVLFLGLEIFVLPGFGVFGFGGIVMILGSLVLASQTFVLPSNRGEYLQLGSSVGVVAAGIVGVVIASSLVRRYSEHIPFVNRFVLAPPEAMSPVRSSEFSREELVGELGVTLTPLKPSGKARFGKRLLDVITDGRMVEKDTKIVVASVHGNRVVVMPSDRAQKAT